MSYEVKYKLKGARFWRRLTGVVGDAIPNFMGDSHVMFVKLDDSAVLVPREGTQFRFGAGRHKMIQAKMHEESGGVVSKD